MQVQAQNNDLMIVPETDFEKEFLIQKFRDKVVFAFVKCGLTPDDIIGLLVCTEKAAQAEERDVVLKSVGFGDTPPSPCLACEHKDRNKNDPGCLDCGRRIDYIAAMDAKDGIGRRTAL